ncbi:hypothetical protein B0H11DRAFT_1737756, partial [Mycena galericulata]
GIYQFIPNTITAPNGTDIVFQFQSPGNHSVTQSSFADPCTVLPGGFDSGFQPVSASATADPTFTITVDNDQHALWIFCRQFIPSSHCNAGMVLVVNEQPGDETFAAFQAAAEAARNPGSSSSSRSPLVRTCGLITIYIM